LLRGDEITFTVWIWIPVIPKELGVCWVNSNLKKVEMKKVLKRLQFHCVVTILFLLAILEI
jgi:hypothetical protein